MIADDKGYVAIWRKLTDHWLWNEDREKTRAEAWIDIIMQVQHSKEPSKHLIRGRIIFCHYGESIKALDTWGSRWKWKKGKVRTFLKLLEKDGQIETVNETVTLRLIVCNYKDYDAKAQSKKTVSSTQNARRTHDQGTQNAPDKNVKNVNNEKNENKSAVKSVDLPTDFDEYVTKFYNEYIMTHYPRSTTKIENERKAVRLLLNKDYNSLSDYHDVLKFLQDDSFWRGNIQSINKLTKIKDGVRYFDKILTKSRELRFTTDKGKTNSQRQTTDISRIKTI